MRRLAPAIPSIALMHACGSAAVDATARTSVVQDSAGIPIVISRAPAWTEGTEWEIGPPLWSSDAALDLFGIVGGVLPDRDRAVVLEEGGSRILSFGQDGALEWTAGGPGDGPGELRAPQAIGIDRDAGVWVYDFGNARVSRFDAGGGLRSVTVLAPALRSGLAVGAFTDGSLLMTGQWSGAAASEGRVRDTVAVVRYGADGGVLDTLGTTPGREYILSAEPDGRRVMSVAIFARQPSVAVWGGRVVLGDQVGYALRVVSPEGDPERVIRWSGPRLRSDPSDVEAWKDAQVASVPPAEREAARMRAAQSDVPAEKPAYGALTEDPQGRLWVAAYGGFDGRAGRWDVFASDGTWLGPVALPERFRLLAVGDDRVLGVMQDELDVERVEVRPLLR